MDRTLLSLFRLSQRQRSGIKFRTVQSNDNRLWPVYHSRPEPETMNDGVPIVFLHGYGNDGATWFPFFPLLGARRELVSPDLPGFGRHLLDPGETPEPQWYCRIVSELLRELTVRWGQPPIVVGKSMGGLLGGLVAGEVPNLVRALVLIAPAGIEAPVVSPFWQAWSGGTNLLLPRNDTEWDDMTALLYARPAHIPGFARREALRTLRDRRDDLERIFAGLLADGYNPLGDSLHRITCPVTVIWGEKDRVMDPSGAGVVREALPSAHIHMLEDCGHSPTRERPDEVGRILLNVISRWG
jgi:abhydrolase domain-containing protein 6